MIPIINISTSISTSNYDDIINYNLTSNGIILQKSSYSEDFTVLELDTNVVLFSIKSNYRYSTSGTASRTAIGFVVNSIGEGFILNISSPLSISTNVPETHYNYFNTTFIAYVEGSYSPFVDTSTYYHYLLDSNYITITKYIDAVAQTPVGLDLYNNLDSLTSDYYINYDSMLTQLTLEHFKQVPFYVTYPDGMEDVGFITNIDGVEFLSDTSSFGELRTIINASDKLNIVFEPIGDNPYYIVNGVVSAGGGSTTPTVDITAQLEEIKTQIDTSITDYFTANPLNVDGLSIGSVTNDVTTALNSFFSNGAYQDLSTISNALETLSTTLSILKTTVENISTDSGTSTAGTTTVDLSEVTNKIDALSVIVEFIRDNPSDMTTIETSLVDINTSISNITTQTVDCASLDLTNLETSILTAITANTHQFITNSSLNGSNGAIYEDGEVLNVEGYVRTYTVVSSQVITTMGNQADYIYLLKDSSERFMITVQDMLSRNEEVA